MNGYSSDISQYGTLRSDINPLSFTLLSSPKTIDVTDFTAFTVFNNTFDENYSGMKGTALYVHDFSKVNITNCSFTLHGPSTRPTERKYSHYMQLSS